jgi:hypothetical protein
MHAAFLLSLFLFSSGQRTSDIADMGNLVAGEKRGEGRARARGNLARERGGERVERERHDIRHLNWSFLAYSEAWAAYFTHQALNHPVSPTKPPNAKRKEEVKSSCFLPP